MAQPQNIDFPNYYPFAPPHPYPFPPYVPPPYQLVAPPFAHPPPKPLNPPPSPIPKPPPHSFSPPPPSPKLPPPNPPHVLPPPLPPPPALGHHTTIIIIFVSVGGVFFLAFLAAALFCFLKKRKRTIKESDDFKFDERMKVKEEVVRGPHGEQAVLVTLEEDIHAHETKIKDEIVGEPSHGGGFRHHAQSHDVESSALSSGHGHVQSGA